MDVVRTILGIVSPVLVEGAKELALRVGAEAAEQAAELWDWLKRRCADDSVVSDMLERFEKKPEVFEPAVEEMLKEKLLADTAFLDDLKAKLDTTGPELSIKIKTNTARDMTALKAKKMSGGKVEVDVDARRIVNSVVTEIDEIG